MGPTHKTITIVDVAKAADVSIGTVSNVLNGTGRVAAATVKKVRGVMDDLDYHPNDMARGLRVIHSRLIGFIMPDMTEFYISVAKRFMKQAFENGYTVLLSDYDYSFNREKQLFDLLIQKRCEVIVVLGGSFDAEYLKEQREKGIKILLIDRRIEGVDFSTIEFDNAATVRTLIGQLRKKGFRRIGYISETLGTGMSNLEDRYAGFRKGMRDNRLPIDEDNIYIFDELQLGKQEHAYEIMSGILREKSKEELPEVFIATSDHIAVGAMDAIKEYGYRVPEDIALVGFDNSLLSRYVTPPLSTIDQDTEQMGQLAWDVASDMMSGKLRVKRNIYLGQKIVFRDSCGK